MAEPIHRIDQQGFARAAAALGEAFVEYPLMVYATPHRQRRMRGVWTLYAAILRDALRYGEVYATADFAAVACWLPPGVAAPGLVRQLRAGMGAMPWRFGWTGFRRLEAYDRVARRLHHQHASQPHWYLAVIGVVPPRQGQGLGSALLADLHNRPAAAGQTAYLETHQEANVRLYEKHGYRVVGQCQPEGHPVPVWGMLRG